MKNAPFIADSPRTEAELLARAEALAGRSLGEVAAERGVPVPTELRRAKGWVGGLMELALGTTAGSRAEADFPELGVELKTLPIDSRGKPLESTFVCSIALRDMAEVEFSRSLLWRKLRRVLWVPVHAERGIPVGLRQIATPWFWSPSADQRELLEADFESAALAITSGQTGELTGHQGVVLQVRPKAARGDSRRRAFDADGALYDEQPKGFYLRPAFTHGLMRERFDL